ncbi:acyclic terpene utilization AtuA family protein [Paraburkholderia fynbosensis]|uniref:Terpene utilization protein AtuA n=1 Tax=Paraburkholderia fynbosensis TaxID=1200993 RepID=A0A6J5H1H1_9BURK|nr:acyclic terpene utilization AtuA family protein [Paraburkholderia fynbosensis]CAB3810474.1 hypothetical protein LMG27177_07232 [Paraburkholderia fynbosensis]
MSKNIVRIGGASGAWGDSPMGVGQLLRAKVDYLMMDYLAEVTMSLLARARMKDPEAGFPPDSVGYLAPHLATLAESGVKVVTNAGGVNPAACKRALEAACAAEGIALSIAAVEGDDMMPLLDELRGEGVRELVSGEPLPPKLLTANAYLGAIPIARALAKGADIVVTGRCADSALALGILMHEFGWREDDYDRLAAGSLVGHLLECGPQATGGVFTDWERVPGWQNIGYPIAECDEDGTFILTKPSGTGGLVEPATVAEQVLYEIGDPRAYILPDVVADFSGVRLETVGQDRVRVSDAKGRPPTTQYKVSATYQDGFRAVAMAVIIGFDAVRKAQRSAEALVARARIHFEERGVADFRNVHIEVLGGEASYLHESRAQYAREVIMRLVVEHDDPKALDTFARELGSVGLSFAQGTAGLIGGRPKPVPVVRLFTFFVDKHRLNPLRVQVGSDPAFDVDAPVGGGYVAPAVVQKTSSVPEDGPTVEVPLLRLAHARSGDKGNGSNIGVFARSPAGHAWLDHWLTPARVAEHFKGTVQGTVTRYDVPGLNAFNFVLTEALGGGGMASMRIDPQGKAFGQRLLEMPIPVPVAWNLA